MLDSETKFQVGSLVIKDCVFQNLANLALLGSENVQISGSTFENLENFYVVSEGLEAVLIIEDTEFRYIIISCW